MIWVVVQQILEVWHSLQGAVLVCQQQSQVEQCSPESIIIFSEAMLFFTYLDFSGNIAMATFFSQFLSEFQRPIPEVGQDVYGPLEPVLRLPCPTLYKRVKYLFLMLFINAINGQTKSIEIFLLHSFIREDTQKKEFFCG